MRTLILGLDNRGCASEHVGLEVARGLHAMLRDPDVDMIESQAAEMDLFEVAAGYDKVVVVDCIRSGEGDVGELRKLGLSDLELTRREGGARDSEYRAAVEVDGMRIVAVPFEISIYAIEAGQGTGRTEDRADAMREAVPRLIAQIAREEFGARMPGTDWL